MTIQEGDLLWQPNPGADITSNLAKYQRWLKEKNNIDCPNYPSLWHWSVTHSEDFWASLWDYFEIQSGSPNDNPKDKAYDSVVDSLAMGPGRQWFTGSKVNWAEHVLRHQHLNQTAIYSQSETRDLQQLSWSELASQVRILATQMRQQGLRPGDIVCSLMPNIPETIVAMLATVSIGAIWSNAAPEFGRQTVLDRFSQIAPKWLFVIDGYQFGGKDFDRTEETNSIIENLSDSLEQVVFLPYLNSDIETATLDLRASINTTASVIPWSDLLNNNDPGETDFHFERVPHNHPLWILFSSGTTGLPKAIAHSHVGALIEQLKFCQLQMELSTEDINFFYTTTGWAMFNIHVGMLLSGVSIAIYDGNPVWPSTDILWQLTANIRATGFGASPTYIQLLDQQGIAPNNSFDLSALKTVFLTGSPSTPETFNWFYQNVKKDLWVASQSGGTEIVSSFVGAAPTLPVYAAEIQSRCLGMDIEAWDNNHQPVVNEVGEFVCKQPFPSMPLCFIGDENNQRYREAYFSDIPGVWRQGDFIKINSRGGCYIYGRSDATLNRYGVRLGTSELYRTVENIEGVMDSLVVCIELPGGKFFMPMFLQLNVGIELNDNLIKSISSALRSQCSPRHVPDKFYVVNEIPYTLSGKKLEVPIRKLLLGQPLDKVVSSGSLKNPQALDFFVNYVTTTHDYSLES